MEVQPLWTRTLTGEDKENEDRVLVLEHSCGAKFSLPIVCPHCQEPVTTGVLVEQLAYTVASLQRQVDDLRTSLRTQTTP